ncbi:hypothetical protein VPH35_111970 [Triticum aestivum]
MRCTICLHRDRIVLAMPLFCHATVPWEPGSREHPTILHDSLTSHFSFASVSPSSYRDRYVAVAPFSDMLPWHHFRYRCRDTIFVIVAVAPLLFRHDDQMLPITLDVNIFIIIA